MFYYTYTFRSVPPYLKRNWVFVAILKFKAIVKEKDWYAIVWPLVATIKNYSSHVLSNWFEVTILLEYMSHPNR